jgi:hypothetical protein
MDPVIVFIMPVQLLFSGNGYDTRTVESRKDHRSFSSI